MGHFLSNGCRAGAGRLLAAAAKHAAHQLGGVQ